MLLELDDSFKYEWRDEGITGLSVPVVKELGKNHGVYQIDPKSL